MAMDFDDLTQHEQHILRKTTGISSDSELKNARKHVRDYDYGALRHFAVIRRSLKDWDPYMQRDRRLDFTFEDLVMLDCIRQEMAKVLLFRMILFYTPSPHVPVKDVQEFYEYIFRWTPYVPIHDPDFVIPMASNESPWMCTPSHDFDRGKWVARLKDMGLMPMHPSEMTHHFFKAIRSEMESFVLRWKAILKGVNG